MHENCLQNFKLFMLVFGMVDRVSFVEAVSAHGQKAPREYDKRGLR